MSDEVSGQTPSLVARQAFVDCVSGFARPIRHVQRLTPLPAAFVEGGFTLLLSPSPKEVATHDKCYQIDVNQRAFSGHARDRRNPVDLARLSTDISMQLLPQDEPT